MFKFGRLTVPANTDFSIINHDSINKGTIYDTTMSRRDFFSRRIDMDDATKTERLMIMSDTIYMIVNNDIYKYDENGFAYKIGTKSNWKDKIKDMFEEDSKKEIMINKLRGDEMKTVGDDEFQDGNNIIVRVKDDTREYKCAVHKDYIRVDYDIYVPKINDNGDIVADKFHQENVLYRTTMKSLNSIIAIPEDRTYFVVDTNNGETIMYNISSGKESPTYPSLDKALEDNKNALLLELKNKTNDFVDLATCDIYVGSKLLGDE